MASAALAKSQVQMSEPSDLVFHIPASAHTLAGFRKWVLSDDFPEHGRVSFLSGEVILDMTNESIDAHVLVKARVFHVMQDIFDAEDLGEFFPDGMLLTNEKAQIANNPDGVAVLWDTAESGRVKYVVKDDQRVEMIGAPDWVMEVVSNSSVPKDTKSLRQAYHAAGIPEYWLIDARRAEISFQILTWRKRGYVVAPATAGWTRSNIFNRDFKLSRKRNRIGAWQYQLDVK